ncbi:MAG: Lsr2 family protein [Actinomycetes bacterium]
MAKKTLIIDDLTGETGARTRTLRFDGVDYEIDLTDASYAELRKAVKPYLKAARQVSGSRVPVQRIRRRAAGSSKHVGAPTEAAVIRAWARANGVAVTERGRVAPAVRDAWVAAGSPR